jgi:tetratricopeptide (TPR) repeat protein
LPEVPGYEVLELVGRGGMGKVYKARHLGMDRVVALKMLAADADADLVARFRVEVQAVAGLQHPHIAQVFEAAQTVEGQPFYVLEFLEGGSLAQRLDGRPQAPREAALLVETVARAVHYSHEHGVLHRDLKPANILLAPNPNAPSRGPTDPDGAFRAADFVPKVADFGLAKRLACDSRLTRTGEVLGTPSYVAPEQASGVVSELGPAVDVYALGAILYETLTGRPPFQGPTPLDTILQVLSLEPVPPSRLQPGVPRDLETICLKCLEKAPKKRYASALELADDLRRYLEGLPIRARAVRAWERALKWARRRPATALLLAVSAAAVLALAGSYLEIRSALSEVREANGQKDLALHEADNNLLLAQGAVERMLMDAADRLASIPQAEPLRRSLVRDAQRFYEHLKEIRPRNAANRFLAAAARRRLADIDQLAGRTAEAEKSYRLALETFAELAREQPDQVENQLALAGTCNSLGNLLLGRDNAAAEAYLRQALVAADHLDDVRAGAEAVRTVGRVRNNLAILLGQTGRAEEAERVHRANLATRRRGLELTPEDPEARIDLAVSHNNLSKLLVGRRQFTEAVEELKQAESLLAAAGDAGEARFLLGQVRANRAGLLAVLGRSEEAGREYEQAVAALSPPREEAPQPAPAHRFLLAQTYFKWGVFFGLAGKEAEAADRVGKARAILQALTRAFPDDPDYRDALRRCTELLGSSSSP